MAGNSQMDKLYNQEKFREMPTKELRECIQQDQDATRASRAQKVLGERGDTGGGTGGTGRYEEGKVHQGGGQRGMKEEGGQQSNYGDERGQGEVGFGETTPNRVVNPEDRKDREDFNR